ncbi:hypothetical protein ONZ45_g19426 [Pleurotus djamor]|nr:hypothetical protein ONZ45_g19426 [Pleurotus djamor]
MKSAFALAVLAATLVAGIGHNSWDQPCFGGECAYDLPDHKGQSGTVKLASFAKSPHAIADITPAAGWVVLDCDPNALQQEIRLVCKSDDAEGAGCNHFFDGGHGPVNKYLRLPESCSSSPFGRVVDFRVHEDQSVPSHHQVTRRDGSAPQVFAVNIDTEFTEIDYSKYGDVHFVAYGASAPGLDTNFAIPSEVDDHAVVDAFLEKALQELIDSSSVPKDQVIAVVYPNSGLVYYPSGKASTTPYKFDEPAGSKKKTGTPFGSEKNTWAKFELKTGDTDLTCKKDLGKGSFVQVGATVTGKLESYFWGTLGWGGAASGKNGVLESVKGFWNGNVL